MNKTVKWLQDVARKEVGINRPQNLYEHSMGKCERIASDGLEKLKKDMPDDDPQVKLVSALLTDVVKLTKLYDKKETQTDPDIYPQVYDKFKLGIEMMCALYGVK